MGGLNDEGGVTRTGVTSTERSTQGKYPWRATVRTFVQAWPVFVLVMVAIPDVVAAIDAEAGDVLPDSVRVWLAAVGTGAAVITATAARVMAVPAVARILELVAPWLAPEPDGEGK